jgi:hypothetical protein
VNNNLLVNSKFYDIKHTAYEKCVFVTGIESKWIISGKDNDLTVTHTAYMDPSGNIPDWIVNTSVTNGPIKTLSNLKKRLNIK